MSPCQHAEWDVNLKARKGKGLLISLIILPRGKWSPKEKEMDRPPRNFPASKHKIRQSFSINIEKRPLCFHKPRDRGLFAVPRKEYPGD